MAGLATLASPGPFKARKKDSEKLLTDFNLYIKAINHLMTLTDNANATDAKKKAMLQAIGGVDMIWLFEHHGKVVDTDTYAGAVAKIKTALEGQTNQASIRHTLFTKMPQGDKPFAMWWSEVKEQSEKCTFDGYDSKMACRDAIVYQTSSKKLRKRVLNEDLDLEATVKLGLMEEQSEMKAESMSRSKEEKDDRIRRLEEEVARLQTKGSVGDKEGKKKGCQTCPRGDQHEGKLCAGRKAEECFSCGKAGHYKGAPICKGGKPTKGKVRYLEEEEENSEEEETESEEDGEVLGRVREEMVEGVRKIKEGKEEMVKVQLRPKVEGEMVEIKWLADSGVKKTLLAEEDFRKVKEENKEVKLKTNKVIFRPYGTKRELPIMGRFKAVLQNEEGKKIKTMVYVVRGQNESLLGKKDGEMLGIIKIQKRGDPPSEDVRRLEIEKKRSKIKEGVVSGGQTQEEIDKDMEVLVDGYPELFQGIGKAKVEPIHIFLKEGAVPQAQKARPVAHQYMEPLRKHLDELLKEGVIEGPLDSVDATDWVSNIVITAKKYDTEEGAEEKKSNIRMNIDTKYMNDMVKSVHFPIPTSDSLRHRMRGSDRFTQIDMNHSFHQFPLDKPSQKLFVFTTPFGLFKFVKLVMGTPPASGECHKRIKQVIEGLDGVEQIKDDLVIHGRGKEHDVRLKAVLERFREYNLTLRREKCKFGQQEVVWFGNVFSKQGMSPDPRKVEIIKNWVRPEDKAAVKSFLQTVQFNSGYMRPGEGKTYSDITKPLRELTRQGVRFVWSQDCEDSFTVLKDLLCSDTVMVPYDPKRRTRIYVDHGPEGVAATVAQRYEKIGEKEEVYRPVAYNSRSLKEAEKSYSKVEGESLAVLSGIMANRQYLYGTKFEVVVDHRPLVALYNSPNRPAPVRVDRHKSKLRSFRFKTVYEPGTTTPSDYGSRHPEPDRKHMKDEREQLGIEDEEEDGEFMVNRVFAEEIPDAVTIKKVREATEKDKELRRLKVEIMEGRKSRETVNSQYDQIFEELAVMEDVIVKGDKIVIPRELENEIIELSHETHGMGEIKTLQLLREAVWFPRMGPKTREFVRTCVGCAAVVPGNSPAPIESQ